MENYVFKELAENRKAIEKMRSYWVTQLSGELTGSSFPYDHFYGGDCGSNKEQYEFRFPSALGTKLIRLSNGSEQRLYAILCCGLSILLYKFTGEQDIVVVSPINKQNETSDLINTIILLRNSVTPISTFKELLYSVYQNINEAVNHQNYPLKRLLAKFNLDYSGAGFPFFGTAVLLENIQEKNYLQEFETNVVFSFKKEGESLGGKIYYNSSLYDKGSIQCISSSLITLFTDLLDDPQRKIKDALILSGDELHQVLVGFNQTDEQFEEDKVIHELFAEQVEKQPDNIGVVFNGKVLTYRELNGKANHLAEILQKKGATGNILIGVLMDRSVEMILSILAILKAGSVYLPIDPKYPKERINYILNDSKVSLLLTNRHVNEVESNKEILFIDEESLEERPNLSISNSPADLAYVIYTSGSTGKPKGVMIEHKGIANLKRFFEKDLQISAEDRILQFASASFDASVWEVFMALLTGASLYLVADDLVKDSRNFTKFLMEYKITVLTLPPPFLALLDPDADISLNKIITAGSATNPALVFKWRNKAEYINAYGPTETTICATIWREKDNSFSETIPIGIPIYNTKVYIMNKDHQAQPVGVPGELCISGAGLARGYLNRPELTEKKFLPNPYLPGERMYKTGDLARWLPDGNIEFLGRLDEQVKVRGFRVEIGEIETVITDLPEIKEVVVVPKTDKNGDLYLVAYYVADTLCTTDLRLYLTKRLPAYMIPSQFVKLAKIPVTPSGKFDKKALEHMEDSIPSPTRYEAPRNDLEKRLARIWEEVLQVSRVGINDNFFELGGHSLKAVQLLSLMEKEGMRVRIGEIFRFQTLKGLAEQINQEKRSCLIKDLAEANSRLIQEFGKEVKLVKYHQKDHNPYILLYLGVDLYREKTKVTHFIKENFDQTICPHYVRKLSDKAMEIRNEVEIEEESFEDFLGLSTKHWGNYLSVLYSLHKMINRYERAILKGEITERYKPATVQKAHLRLANHHSGNVYTFDRFFLDTEFLKKAIALVVQEQSVLRSVLIKEDEDLWWEERALQEEISIPFADLSQWKVKNRKKIRKLITGVYFKRHLFQYNSLLYRPILIQENLRVYHLIFPCDHCIFDGMSGDILYRRILDYCAQLEAQRDGDSNPSLPPTGYKNYLEVIERGPQGIEEERLITAFRLRDFYDSLIKLGKSKKKLTPGLFEWEIDLASSFNHAHMRGVDLVWDITFYLFVVLCHKYFNTPSVPVRIVYHGRQYGKVSFFDTIGEFLDLIPVCIQVTDDPNRMPSITNQVQGLLELVPKYNINFMNLMYNQALINDWVESSQLLIPTETKHPLLIFNYQGHFSLEEIKRLKEISYGIDGSRAHALKDFSKTPGIIFNVVYCAEKALITVGSSYAYDHRKLVTILKEETVNILTNLSSTWYKKKGALK